MVSQLFDSEESIPIKGPALRFFRRLGVVLRNKCVIPEPRPSNYFNTVSLVERELKNATPNWCKIRSKLLANNQVSFPALQERMRTFLKAHQMKEYYIIVGGLLRLRTILRILTIRARQLQMKRDVRTCCLRNT